VRQLGGPIPGSAKGVAGDSATTALQSLEQSLVEAVSELERLALNSTKGSKGTAPAPYSPPCHASRNEHRHTNDHIVNNLVARLCLWLTATHIEAS
jgi:hypothetical protein